MLDCQMIYSHHINQAVFIRKFSDFLCNNVVVGLLFYIKARNLQGKSRAMYFGLILAIYQIMTRSEGVRNIGSPSLMPNAVKKGSRLRKVAFTRQRPSE